MKVRDALTDEAERLLRQVTPGCIRGGRPSSQLFEPKARDEGMLSVGLERLRGAPDFYEFFVRLPRCRSLGILAVTVGDCVGESLPAHHAPMSQADGDPWDDDAHGIVDFRQCSAEQCEEKAEALHRAAMNRGYVYQPSIAKPAK